MKAWSALLRRELLLAARSGGDVLTQLLFFVLVGVIVPFAIGPDTETLARISAGVVFIAAFLSLLLTLDRLFRTDWEDGSLTLLRFAALPLEAVVGAKLLAHWLTAALPLLLVSPVLAVLLAMSGETLLRTVLALLVGTPGLVALGAMGAAITVSLGRGGLLAPVLILPLAIPLLIFGVGASTLGEASRGALSLLGATSLVLVAVAPFAAALALKSSEG